MKTPKECRDTRREIDEALADAQLARHVREHLGSCSSCREAHDQHIRLTELVGSLQPVTAPADFDIRLRARLLRGNNDRRWFSVPRLAFGTSAMALGAAVVLLVGAVVLVNQMGFFRIRSGEQVVSQPLEPGKVNQLPAPPAVVNQTSPVSNPQSGQSTTGQNPLVAARPLKESTGPKRKGLKSDDFAVMPAPSIRRSQGESDAAEISLSQPFEFSLQDSQGVTRKFSLPRVTFGSQQLVRRGQPYQPASYAGNRIW